MEPKNKPGKLFLTGVVILIVAIGYTLLRLVALGVFYRMDVNPDLDYTVLADYPGPEALQIDREQGILYFISNNPCDKDSEPGGLYLMVLDQGPGTPRKLAIEQPEDFYPHGLSFFRDSNGLQYLFTNNHRSDGTHTVELFRIESPGSAQHLSTIGDPKLTSPNDLVAVGPNQFFVTIDGRAHDLMTRSIDTFLGRSTGTVLYFDGTRFKTVVEDMYFPNGITYDPASNRLMVTETLTGNLIIFSLGEEQQVLARKEYYIAKGLDNISMNENEDLLVAAHPNLLALSNHMKNTDMDSPSQVFNFNLHTKESRLIFQDQGNTLSGISAAIAYQENLYLGSVCEAKLIKVKIGNDK